MMYATIGARAAAIAAAMMASCLWPQPSTSWLLRHAFADDSTARIVTDPDDAAIQSALDSRHEFSFFEMPLADVASHLEELLDIQVTLDQRSLDELQIKENTPVTFHLHKPISVRAFLNHALGQIDLNHCAIGNILVITTEEEASSPERELLGVYPVWDLVAHVRPDGKINADYECLIDLITTVISPTTWDEVGGPGAIHAGKGNLFISQIERVHRQIGDLLCALRQFPRFDETPHDFDVRSVGMKSVHNWQAPIENALNQISAFEHFETPLSEFVSLVSETFDIPVILDVRALNDLSINADTPITVDLKDVSLKTALSSCLTELELDYVLADETLLITTEEEANSPERMATVVYWVGDWMVGSEDPRFEHVESELDEMTDTIASVVATDSWDEVGGPGTINLYVDRTVLVCSQTGSVQAQVAIFLAKLRKARTHKHAMPAEVDESDLYSPILDWGLTTKSTISLVQIRFRWRHRSNYGMSSMKLSCPKNSNLPTAGLSAWYREISSHGK